MCGIFGIATKPSSGLDLADLQSVTNALFILSESRGREASGIAFLNHNSIEVLKAQMPASRLIKTREYKCVFERASLCYFDEPSDNGHHILALLGHSRLVTNGLCELPHNNQPIISNTVVGVHNGIIVNDLALWDRFRNLERKCEVDTEVILALIRHFHDQSRNLIDAVQQVYGLIQGVANIATFFTDINALLLATNNGSMYFCENVQKNFLMFASEEHILTDVLRRRRIASAISPYEIEHVASQTAYIVPLDTFDIQKVCLNGRSSHNGKAVEPMVQRNVSVCNIVAPRASRLPSLVAHHRQAKPSWFVQEYEQNAAAIAALRRCSRCILPETVPFLTFDENNICSVCRNDILTTPHGLSRLEMEIAKYRKQNGKPDVLVPLSGGRDSCYALHYVKKCLNLNPIAFTYDWGMVTDLARRNQSRICAKLGIEHVVVSADISRKREFIRLNVEAWLRRPDMGIIPLFMAGDKQFFYYANQVRKRYDIGFQIWAVNPYERTEFKHGYCGVKQGERSSRFYRLSMNESITMASYYTKAFLTNPSYINRSLFDTMFSYFSYYIIPHRYLLLYDYVPWDEQTIERTLIEEYDWETSPDTDSTWRIGDGTAAFYNYIYWTVGGFSEVDTFHSNQVRHGMLERSEALSRAMHENQPRYDSMAWYCDIVGLDLEYCLRVINGIPKRYSTSSIQNQQGCERSQS